MKKKGIFIIYLTYLTILQSCNFNWISTLNFQLKLFDIAVILKYGQSHWKWYEQVKLNKSVKKYFQHGKFDIYHIYDLCKVSDMTRHLTDGKHVHYLPWIHTSQTKHIVHNLFNVCSNHTSFKLQRPRIKFMQFAIQNSDIPVSLKQNQGHKTCNENVHPKQRYNQAKFERFCFNCVRKKANVNFVQIGQYLPWTCVKIKNSGIIMIYLTQSKSFKVSA